MPCEKHYRKALMILFACRLRAKVDRIDILGVAWQWFEADVAQHAHVAHLFIRLAAHTREEYGEARGGVHEMTARFPELSKPSRTLASLLSLSR